MNCMRFGTFTLLPCEQRQSRKGTEVAIGLRAFRVPCAVCRAPWRRGRVVEAANLHMQVSPPRVREIDKTFGLPERAWTAAELDDGSLVCL